MLVALGWLVVSVKGPEAKVIGVNAKVRAFREGGRPLVCALRSGKAMAASTVPLPGTAAVAHGFRS